MAQKVECNSFTLCNKKSPTYVFSFSTEPTAEEKKEKRKEQRKEKKEEAKDAVCITPVK